MTDRTERPRLDQLMVERQLAPSREKAQALILAGDVFVDGQRSDKPGVRVPEEAKIEVADRGTPYVSRGGEKLESAWEAFRFEAQGRICLDVGASTGGFTDFLLRRGAARVYAVDVGYGQLAWSLRTDKRVVVHERVNARHLSRKEVPDPIDLCVADVSFISIEKVLPAVSLLLTPVGEIVCLIKPQFEAGPGRVGKKGVVREAAVHTEILEKNILSAPQLGFGVRGATFSKLQGPEGNIEFFLWMARGAEPAPIDAALVVASAHRHFNLE